MTTPREKCLKSFLKYSKIRHSFLRVGFESRLVLSMIEKRVIRWMALFSMFEPSRARTVRMSPLRSGRRSRTSPGRSATSRALKEIEKRVIRWMALFVCSSPAGLERFECLRSAPVVAGERPPDVLRRLVLFFIRISSVDVLFL